MKCLVTGGAGFIGSHIVDKLIEDGHHVVVVDDESADSNERFYWNNSAENHKIDICDYDLLRPLMNGVSCVFHLAAESRIQPAIKNPLYAAKVNFLGTCTVLQCAREASVDRVIYSSTSSGYGLKNIPPLSEDMPRDCLNPYSVTKCGGEDLCSMYYRLFGLKTVIFRYFNVYGERQPVRGEYAPVIGLFLRQSKNLEPMTIVGDGQQKRDFTYVKDVVEANVCAMNTHNPQAWGEVFNVGTGKNYTIKDLVHMIGTPYTHIKERLGEARESLANIQKITTILEWEPRHHLDEWVSKQLERKDS
jgi:UDP-glucose 4-epimerase